MDSYQSLDMIEKEYYRKCKKKNRGKDMLSPYSTLCRRNNGYIDLHYGLFFYNPKLNKYRRSRSRQNPMKWNILKRREKNQAKVTSRVMSYLSQSKQVFYVSLRNKTMSIFKSFLYEESYVPLPIYDMIMYPRRRQSASSKITFSPPIQKRICQKKIQEVDDCLNVLSLGPVKAKKKKRIKESHRKRNQQMMMQRRLMNIYREYKYNVKKLNHLRGQEYLYSPTSVLMFDQGVRNVQNSRTRNLLFGRFGERNNIPVKRNIATSHGRVFGGRKKKKKKKRKIHTSNGKLENNFSSDGKRIGKKNRLMKTASLQLSARSKMNRIPCGLVGNNGKIRKSRTEGDLGQRETRRRSKMRTDSDILTVKSVRELSFKRSFDDNGNSMDCLNLV